ncbi:fasciclin domain-containing protein [Flavobacterium undicola]|uniref:fasciclin domain-containing protein n=1 Tax=Flavobacterium undicola TaxID=1932779 RepID=UPI0013785620|nr:fasciclin domain-containing protein [Flavobacterium undicola]MBA0883583.1 fasciclin domain-containing protein [Flavobacterium undicola]
MISLKINYKRLFVGLLTIALVSCSNPWEDRENNGDANLSVTLSEAITNTTEVSQFGQLLVQTGYDKVLAASKTYTVFVPTNEAMDQVDDAILNDPEALKKFVANHIALTAYSSIRTKAQEKIKMLGDKYLLFKGATMIDDATIVTADHYAANGVFHIINKALTPKLNIWQYINSNSGSAMSQYLLSLKNINIYTSDAEAKANAVPGALADSLTNSYLKNVYNLNNEKNSYTLFLMQDAGYSTEVDKMKPYLTVATPEGTAALASYFTVRDMAFPNAYELNQLPATLTSRFGVEFPVDKTQIVGNPIHLSNGVIYIMKKVDVSLTKRLLTTKIEGEKNYGYVGTRTPILYRDRIDPFGVLFNDIMVQTPARAKFTLTYYAKDIMYSTKYKVYWRAINDQSGTFQQQLAIGGNYDVTTNNIVNMTTTFPLITVPFKNYDEILLGEFTKTNANNTDLISLIGGTSSTSALTLDYLKFVPVLK